MATPTSPNEHIHRARRRKVSPSYSGGNGGSNLAAPPSYSGGNGGSGEGFRLGIKQAGPGDAAKCAASNFWSLSLSIGLPVFLFYLLGLPSPPSNTHPPPHQYPSPSVPSIYCCLPGLIILLVESKMNWNWIRASFKRSPQANLRRIRVAHLKIDLNLRRGRARRATENTESWRRTGRSHGS